MIPKTKHLISAVLAFAVIFTALIGAVPGASAASEPLKKRVTYFSEEERANLRENVSKLAWAKSDGAYYAGKADPYVSRGYDFLWNVLPSQGLPRSYGVNQKLGCLSCGKAIDKYGNYPYKYDVLNDPWKLTCPSCGMKFPTNDFKSFYESALDENGNFDASRGDKKYLKNVLYPSRGEDWGVDDGWGYTSSSGALYTFVAYYNHFAIYDGGMESVLTNIYNAYLYTGEQKYADAGIVLLDRMAQIYPDMNIKNQTVSDGFLHSHGGRNGYGKIVGCIWECSIIRPYIIAYDAFFPAYETMSKEAKDFLSKVSGGKRNTANELKIHVEDGLIKEIFPAVKAGYIHGNQGMHQQTLAAAAVVLDDPTLTKQWMDYNMSSTGGALLTVFVNSVDRDGYGNEAAPGYNSGWIANFLGVAETLRGYRIGGKGESYDLYENVKFRKMVYSFLDLIISGKFTPPIGDTGKTGYAAIYARKDVLLSGYLAYGDDYLAQALYLVNGNSSKNLRLSAFEKDPDGISRKVQNVIDAKGTIELGSINLTGYGYAVVRGSSAGTGSSSSAFFPFASLEVLRKSEKENLTFSGGDDGYVQFKNGSGHASASFGFYLPGEKYVSDLAIRYVGTGSDSVLDVYADGRAVQKNVRFSAKKGEVSNTRIKNTRELSRGYHVLTLRFVSGSSVTLSSFSLLSSTTAKAKEQSMYIYYGRNTGHGHADNLNLGLYAYGMDLMPDMGYPEFADSYDMHRRYFVTNTVSHNTVAVNESQQRGVVVSDPLLFDSSEFVKLISVDGKGAYAAASEYRRTTAMISLGDGTYYLADFFNVTGGTSHVYSLHGASAQTSVSSLNITKQTNSRGEYVGTLAGADVAFGSKNLASGYQYFRNVRRDASPSDNFSVDWTIKDTWGTATSSGVHLKVTMIGDYGSAVLADGTPPTNKPGNPSAITYLLVERKSGGNLRSLFNSVIEPYTGSTKIVSAEKIPVLSGGKEVNDEHVRALKITLSSGRTDYVAYNALDRTRKLSVNGVFEFTGTFAVYSVSESGAVVYSSNAVVSGHETGGGRITGRVTDFTRTLSTENTVTVKLDSSVDPAILAGRYVYIDRLSGASFNACYRIISAEKKSDTYVLNIGDVTPVESYKNAANMSGGFNYSIAVGKSLYIPLSGTETGGNTVFSGVTLATDAKNGTKKGSFIGNLYAVNTTAKTAFGLIPYDISLAGTGGDNAGFEIRGNRLYAAADLTSGAKYTLSAYVNYKKDGKSASDPVSFTVSVLSPSDSVALSYPDFSLEPDPDTSGHTHSPYAVAAVAASCLKAGNRAYYVCSVCGKYFSDAGCKNEIANASSVVIPATGHSFGKWTPDGDRHVRQCKCGEKQYAAHVWDEGTVTVSPSHTSEGVKTFTCTACGAKKTETLEKITRHSFGEWTPEGDGHSRVCECGEKEYGDHTWDEGAVTVSPSHTSEGVKTFTCTACGAKKTETLEKIAGHSFGEWTPEGDGHVRECECGEKEYGDHTWDGGAVTVSPSHTSEGVKTFTCTACGAKKTETLEKIAGHSFGEWTPEGDGHVRVCECGEKEYGDHSWDERIGTDGAKKFICTLCGAERTESALSRALPFIIAGASALCALAVILIIRIRKKKAA